MRPGALLVVAGQDDRCVIVGAALDVVVWWYPRCVETPLTRPPPGRNGISTHQKNKPLYTCTMQKLS
jgi:hypothetical protein